MTSTQTHVCQLAILIGLLAPIAGIEAAEEGGANPDYTPLGYWPSSPESQPGNEVFDLVFVIDGSNSINSGGFPLQKEGIKNCVVGPDKFIPYDGTVAVAVIQFSDEFTTAVEIHLTVIDSEETAINFNTAVDDITQIEGWTSLDEGLRQAIGVFEEEAFGEDFTLIVSTDVKEYFNPQNPNSNLKLQLGEDIRTKSGEAEGMAHPARICTVYVDKDCDEPDPGTTPNAFLRMLANTEDSGEHVDPTLPGPAYPDQPVGHFMCAENLTEPGLENFVLLCKTCVCEIVHAGGQDCDEDGIPDICEDDPPMPIIIYVDQDPDITGTRDGTSWATAHAELVEALNEVEDSAEPACFEIWVAEGTYLPDYDEDLMTHTGNRELSFWLMDNVGIYGGFDGYSSTNPSGGETERNQRLPASNPTILSGDLNGDDSYHVVTAENVSRFAILDGFIVAYGNADGAAGSDRNGGGIHCSNGGNATIASCVIGGSWASDNGGGVYCGNASTPRIQSCILVENRASNGGGVYCGSGSDATVTNCTVIENTASDNGGGVYCDSSDPAITNSIVWDNVPEQIYENLATAAVTYCDVQGGWSGTRNIALDPLFVDDDGPDDDASTWEDNDYRLFINSPCLGMGDNGGPAMPVFDFELDDRIQYCAVDIGADEADHFRDCNSNGIADACDIHNGTSTDCDEDGIPDDCEPDDDADEDGVSNAEDNCVCDYNPDQRDCDGDGIGNVCDPTPSSIFDYDADDYCDVDQVDFGILQRCATGPGDTLEDVFPESHPCRNPYLYNLQVDVNADDHVDMMDVELMRRCVSGPTVPADMACGDCDGDDIHDAQQDFDGDDNPDGDFDLDGIDVRGQPVCVCTEAGVPTGCDENCDDNCPCDPNPDQVDADGDGVGDECGGAPMAPLGGPMGGEPLAASVIEPWPWPEPEPEPEPAPLPVVSAAFVVHDGGEDAVALPPGGGTVVVDLVLTSDGPIAAFEGRPAIDGPGTVLSVTSADWSDRANVLMSYGLGDVAIASSYDCTLMDWYLVDADGRMVPSDDPSPLLDPDGPDVITITLLLDALAGPVATPQGELVTTPGTYQLTFIDGKFVTAEMLGGTITTGPGLAILVQTD